MTSNRSFCPKSMSANLQNGPIPSRLTLLSKLNEFAEASKVRFLGCVTKYSDREATLTLEHNYPPGNALHVLMDASLVLETMESNDFQIGSWINVVGYIKNFQRISTPSSPSRLLVHVQGIIVWPAGPLNIDSYERTLNSAHIDSLGICSCK